MQEATAGVVDHELLAQAINVCAKANGSQAAIEVLECYAEAADEACFVEAISACRNDASPERARELLKRLRGRGINVPAAAYNAAMDTCFAAQDACAAVALFNEIHSSATTKLEKSTVDTMIVSASFSIENSYTRDAPRYIDHSPDCCILYLSCHDLNIFRKGQFHSENRTIYLGYCKQWTELSTSHALTTT